MHFLAGDILEKVFWSSTHGGIIPLFIIASSRRENHEQRRGQQEGNQEATGQNHEGKKGGEEGEEGIQGFLIIVPFTGKLWCLGLIFRGPLTPGFFPAQVDVRCQYPVLVSIPPA